MKTHLHLYLLTTLFLSPGFLQANEENHPVMTDPEALLQIIIYDNIMPKRNDYWTTPRMESDRFRAMKRVLERLAKDRKGDVKIYQFAAGIPEADQVLELYVYRWEEGLESFGRSITVEFAMDAKLTVRGTEFDMGSFTARSSHYASGGVDPDDYGPAAERAIEQMIEFYRSAIGE